MAGFFAHGATMTIDGVAIGGLLDIPIPERDREEVETTDQGSEFNREYVPGLIDNGVLDITMRMVPGDPGQTRMRTNAEAADEVVEFVITAPPHVSPRPVWTFDGFVRVRGGTLFWENTAAERTVTIRVSSNVAETEIS